MEVLGKGENIGAQATCLMAPSARSDFSMSLAPWILAWSAS
jgi:hypothetical protein